MRQRLKRYWWWWFSRQVMSDSCDPMDCSLLGSSVHGILQARILELSCCALLQGIFLTQGWNLGLLHCRQMIYRLSYEGISVGCMYILMADVRVYLGFPGGSDGKESACNAGEPYLVPGSGRFPWRRGWQPTPIFLPGESHGQRSLMGYIQSMGLQRVRHDFATNNTHLPHVGPALCPSQLGPSFCLLLRARAMGIRPQSIQGRDS